MTATRRGALALAASALGGLTLLAVHAWANPGQLVPRLVVLWDDTQWVPAGGKDEQTPGNWVRIEAKVVNEEPHGLGIMGGGGGVFGRPSAAPAPPPASTPAVRKYTFELLEVSREPGVCMNWPVALSADADYDLKFDPRKNRGLDPPLTISPKSLKAETPEGEYHKPARVFVAAYDWGAYGKLRVTAELKDGQKLTEDQLLPLRQPGSRIADAWKQANHVLPFTPDDADDADQPRGAHPDQADPKVADLVAHGSAVKGDGLTLYEKYRGFMVQGRHKCADPHRKNVFVYDALQSLRSLDGVALFRALSGLAVHRLRFDEIGPRDTTSYLRSGRIGMEVVVNANCSGHSPHLALKYGIYLVGDAEAYAPCVGEGGPGTPKQAFITGGLDPGPLGWRKFPSGGVLILSDKYAKTIAHEMLHCCNVPHHGDHDPGWVTWRPSTQKPGGIEEVREGGDVRQITVRREEGDGDGVRLPLPFKLYVSGPHGQHSGCVDCVMRYDYAAAYVPEGADSSVRILVPGDMTWVRGVDVRKGLGEQLTGVGLCDAAEDQPGAVDPLGHPLPHRHGPADQGRGYCKSQICVNDDKGP